MGFVKHLSLDSRLSAIADMVGYCSSCADIGCDHGRLGAYLLQNHRCERVVLTDISPDSLIKARKLIALIGEEANCEFRLGDGALALVDSVDTAVIAGIGGKTIADIVERASGRLDGSRLILQPNVDAPELRKRLNATSWCIEDEELVKDGHRIYVIICAKQGIQHLNECELEIGPVMLKKKHPLLDEYVNFRLRVDRKALAGAQAGSDEAAINELTRRICIWEEVEAWQ